MEGAHLARPVAISVFVILILALAWRFLEFIWLRPKKIERMLKQQGLSANSYRFLIGDLKIRHQLRKRAASSPMTDFSHDIFPRIEPLMHHTIKKHGSNSFAWMGPQPIVYATEPESIRELYSRPNDFEKLNFKFMRSILPGLVGYEGDKWTNAKKVVNPIFSLDRIKLMVPTFHESCCYMLSIWDRKMSESRLLELDIYPELGRLAGDAISRVAFTRTFREEKRIFELIDEQFDLVDKNFFLNCIPGLRFLPTKAKRRMMDIDQELDKLIQVMICQRMSELESGKDAKRDDMLDMLLESNKQCQHSLTIGEVIQHCKLFYIAGADTVSLLLTWTMILLSKHQFWQKEAREEVTNAFGSNIPDYKELTGLKTVNMVLWEVLRLYPPVSLEGRRVKKECTLGNLSLPTNTLIYVSATFIHHSPDLWGEDANEFNPERFSEGISKATKRMPIFFPFGSGARACIGQNAAMLEARMVLAMILQKFSFELSPSYSHAPSQGMTLHPQFGAQIVLRPL